MYFDDLQPHSITTLVVLFHESLLNWLKMLVQWSINMKHYYLINKSNFIILQFIQL